MQNFTRNSFSIEELAKALRLSDEQIAQLGIITERSHNALSTVVADQKGRREALHRLLENTQNRDELNTPRIQAALKSFKASRRELFATLRAVITRINELLNQEQKNVLVSYALPLTETEIAARIVDVLSDNDDDACRALREFVSFVDDPLFPQIPAESHSLPRQNLLEILMMTPNFITATHKGKSMIRKSTVTCILITALMIAGVLTAGEWFIPAAAHNEGAENSQWRTKFMANNYGPSAEVLRLTLLPQNENNAGLATYRDIDLLSGETLEINDILAEVFNFTGTAALKINCAGSKIVISSRTFNQTENGTFGQFIPSIAASSAIAATEPATLMGLSGTDGRRTNIGMVSLEGEAITVIVELFKHDGSLVTSKGFNLEPFEQIQFNLFTKLDIEPIDNVYAVLTADGTFQPYASVVAGGSNDPIYVAALGNFDIGTDLIFPAAAHITGDSDTNWATDIWLVNPSSSPASIYFEYWQQGQANSNPFIVDLSENLAPGAQVELKDIINSSFGVTSGQGAISVHSTQRILATSRTFNTASIGTFGQFIPAQKMNSLGAIGETLYLPGAVDSDAFRSNLGLVANTANSVIALTLRGSDGSILASTTKTLRLNEQYQVRVSNIFGIEDFSSATVEVELQSTANATGSITAYLSIVDEETTDPTYALASRSFTADVDVEAVSQTVVTTAYALSVISNNAGPNARALPPKTTTSCLTVDYSANEVGFGESPEGQCWASTIGFDQCSWDFVNAGWGITQSGSVDVDACVIDDYPSTINANLQTEIRNLNTGERSNYSLDTVLKLILGYDGLRPESGQLIGWIEINTDTAMIEAWADLYWAANLTGLEFIPSGTVEFLIPYSGAYTAAISAVATFDGTEWVFVQARAGVLQTSLYVNIYTGEVILA